MVMLKTKESESVTRKINNRLVRLRDAEKRIAHHSEIQKHKPSLLNESDLAIAKADKANISVELTFLERERALLLARKENTNEQTNEPQPGNDN